MRQKLSFLCQRTVCVRLACLLAACSFTVLPFIANAANNQPAININTIKIVDQTHDFIDLMLSGNNHFKTGSICLRVIMKTANKKAIGANIKRTILPGGDNQQIPVRVIRIDGSHKATPHKITVNAFYCMSKVQLYRKVFVYKNGEIKIASVTEFYRQHPTAPMPFSTRGEISYDLNTSNYIDMEVLMNKLNNQKENDESGSPKLDYFRSSVNSYADSETDMRKGLRQLSEWHSQKRHSSAAAISEAIYLMHYAWHLRGGRNSGVMDPFTIEMFGKRMDQAEKILIDARAYASSNPLWYDTYIRLAIDMGKSFEFINVLYHEGVKKFPFYTWLYVDMAAYYAPIPPNTSQRKSDWVSVDKIVKQAVTSTVAVDGLSEYAWIYMHINYQHDTTFNLFRDSRVSWPEFRDSFKDLIKRYPATMNYNRLASYACEAGDKKIYIEMELKINGNYLYDYWLPNYTRDVCDHMFLKDT